MDTAHLDGAYPRIQIRPRSDEIRNGQLYHAHDPSIDVHPPHTLINPPTLASRIPRQLINPPRDLRNSPYLPIPTGRRVNTSPTHAIPFSPPESKKTNTSVPARRGTRPATPHVALTLTAPVLAVWRRTLATAGLGATVPTAGGDHNVLSVAPYLVLVDFASWTRDALFPPDRCVLSCFVLLCFC